MADEWSYESAYSWAGLPSNPADAYPVILETGTGNFYQADSPLATTIPLSVVLERVGIPFKGERVDPLTVKLLTGIWPLISGTPGDQISVYLGMQEKTPADPVTWSGPFTFTIGTTEFIDATLSGRYAAVRFESSGVNPWTLIAYDLEYEVIGIH